MWTFLREVYPLLERRGQRRLVWAIIFAIVLALLEALGIALVLPLVHSLVFSSSTSVAAGPSALDLAPFGSRTAPVTLAAAVFAAFMLKGVLGVFLLRSNISFVLSMETEAAARALDAYLRAPYALHLRRNSADIQEKINNSLRRVYQEGLVGAIGGTADAVTIAAIAVVLTVIEPPVALFGAFYFALVAFGYQRLLHGKVHEAGTAITASSADAIAAVQQAVASLREVKLRAREVFFVDALRSAKTSLATGVRTVLILAQLPRYYLELVLLGGIGGLAVILFNTRPQAEAISALGLFVAAGLRFLPALNRAIVGQNYAKATVPALRQVASDLSQLQRVADHRDTGRLTATPIELADVSFTHAEAAEPTLQGISLTISPGEAVAFVGASGAGKTTLVDVILGFLEPSTGEVRIGGHPLRTVRAQWHAKVGYVPQNVVMLNDSLLANIAFGLPEEEVDYAAVEAALRDAQLEDLVTTIPEGLRTSVAENGVRLSGGQRQRVGLARALYSDPAVLVLDEATSALDSETEAKVTATLRGLRGARTMIIVAHRLSTIRDVDRIYFLKAGRVQSSGGFDELRTADPDFERLVTLASVSGETVH